MRNSPFHSLGQTLAQSKTISSALRKLAKRGKPWQTQLQLAMSAVPISHKERDAIDKGLKALYDHSSVPNDLIYEVAFLDVTYEKIRLILEDEYRPPTGAELNRCKQDWQTVLLEAIQLVLESIHESIREDLKEFTKRSSIPADDEFDGLLSIENHWKLHRAIQNIGRQLRSRKKKPIPDPENCDTGGSDLTKPSNGPDQPLSLEFDVEDRDRVAKDLADEEVNTMLKSAIADLDNNERRAIKMRVLEDWSYAKMVREWGGSNGRWYRIHERACQKLRDALIDIQ